MSFDEAFRQVGADRQSRASHAAAAANSDRAIAEPAAAELSNAIQDFCRTLIGRVEPQRFELPAVYVRRTFGSNSKKQHSPAGFAVYVNRGIHGNSLTGLTVITPDSRVWAYPLPREAKDRNDRGDFVPITGESILQGRIYLAGGGISIKDGRAVVTNGWSDGITIEASLAGSAHRLIAGERL